MSFYCDARRENNLNKRACVRQCVALTDHPDPSHSFLPVYNQPSVVEFVDLALRDQAQGGEGRDADPF